MANEQQTMNKLRDFISGKEIRESPEEKEAVQPFLKILHEDYGYPKNLLQAHPQYRVKASPSDKKGYPIDIAVFETIQNEKKLKIVVECKKKDRKDGIEQLKSYLKFCEARIGIWFNGEESVYIQKIEKSGNIVFEEISAFPKHNEKLSEIGKYLRKDLKPTHNLKEIFKEIRGRIVANSTGVNRDEQIAKEMILLILCKIYDERFTANDKMVRFRASVDESDKEVRDRIDELFADIQQKYDDVLNKQDTITFDSKTLKLVVGKLQNICITETDRDSVGDAFEVFIGYSLKGSQGQFFTPKNVVRLMVEIVAPDKKHTIIDPACGSCGFLVESLKYLWHTLDKTIENEISRAEEKMALAIKNIRGIEKDSFLTKVGKAYMTILGDGKGGIFCEDSLELPKNWGELTKSQIKLESFDLSFSNPPFGKDIKVTGKDKLAQYALNLNKKEGNVSTLFLERNLQLLKKGGRLAIILPETYFHAPSTRYVREFLTQHNIEWLIDIPHNTFRPHNNAKCIILILQKDTKQQKFINMAVAEFAGHDHNGKAIYHVDGSVKDDTPTIIDEVRGRTDEKKYTFEVEAHKVIASDILIPRYFWKSKELEIADIAHRKNLNMVSLQELIDHACISFFDGHGSPKGELKGEGSIPYIRVKDIVNWQIYKDPTAMIPTSEYDRLFSKAKQLKPKDILFVKRGSYRIGSVAMVSPNDTHVILTREILVLRVNTQSATKQYGMTPEYLLYAMSHVITYKQLENKIFIDTTLPNIADRWKELQIPIPRDASQLEQITKKVKSAITKQWGFLNIVDTLKNHNDVFYT
ncbi:hypothetical protein NHP190003_15120 [Helicobacter sp. NHP19-003]|uniref:Restriction endonuclease subunit M n=2 Tax=Helicobacter gastrocanis TaxID=2849641 RepID=A0ABM7SC25_9HELI|nr:hypothetical protein NHP190003_15120 [Helicobacter sp. NHP19-003]